jgi:hypothetical protein
MKVRCGDYFEVHCSCGDTSLFKPFTSIPCFMDVIYSMKTAHMAKISKAKSVAAQVHLYRPFVHKSERVVLETKNRYKLL